MFVLVYKCFSIEKISWWPLANFLKIEPPIDFNTVVNVTKLYFVIHLNKIQEEKLFRGCSNLYIQLEFANKKKAEYAN